MKIEFPLLSICSLIVLLFFGFQGDVELYSLEIGFNVTADEVKMTVDPVWVVWGNEIRNLTKHCGFALGNVIGIEKSDRDTVYGRYILAEEINHVQQFRALGLSVYLAQAFLPIENPTRITRWNHPEECNKLMWLPPSWWISQWHFITSSYDI